MKVLVDTSVWSLALRRKAGATPPEAEALRRLIDDNLVVMIGPVRQELLSGIRHVEQFDRLRERLSAFPNLTLNRGDFESAAELCNRCMAEGVQATHTDFLIAATAMNNGYAVFSTDKDFLHIATIAPVALYDLR